MNLLEFDSSVNAPKSDGNLNVINLLEGDPNPKPTNALDDIFNSGLGISNKG